MIDRSDTHWYRDAIIYQIHVKSFFDANNDGMGDFVGLTEKLDYIRDLGVTAIWLMPFYPSPLRDDGYDISDYRGINPNYGTLRDFRRFVRAAHERGLRVITELVINHTSDQHPWFQRARQAPPGSAARRFYVWSDTDRAYADTRIIFLDTEASNWSWDPVAKQYFWHRFYSHQPDLNFDNPRVLEAVIEVMRYWLDMGVDGLRLDAIPYLIEREGTNCENLPETHNVIKAIRAALDAAYQDRMLLAEANQWPEDTAPYFGSGDECHMAFHFPLMPRMYMAVAQEDRHPITDIMRQTPDIPEGCQWAIFLRNHDELTLEMVTDEERDYLWSFYAADRRARINLGIRRRLAPLLGNDRRKVELLNSLLLSMPGTPVLYYGDEIGMGDNIYLGDRDGVRTPMQWSPDRNGGFSRADPAKLFLPAIQDPIYGFDAVNVEAQLASPASQLNWMRRMIAIRRARRAFGRGSLQFLYPANRKVLAYVRGGEGECLLCVANLSRSPQAVELDLSEFRGRTPIELTGGTAFPRIGELPYLLTLPAYGFYWFDLSGAPAAPEPGASGSPELFTLVLSGGAETILAARERRAFEETVAPRHLVGQRWFAGRSAGTPTVAVQDVAVLPTGSGPSALLAILETTQNRAAPQRYFVPLVPDEAGVAGPAGSAIARVRRGRRVGLLFPAAEVPAFAAAVVEAIRAERALPTEAGGTIRFSASPGFAAEEPVAAGEIRPFSTEQSNTSINLGDRLVLKLLRRLQAGVHPDIEVGRFLTAAGFPATPALLGAVEHVAGDGTPTALAILQPFVRNQGDGWVWATESLKRLLDTAALVPDVSAAIDADPGAGAGFAGGLPLIEAMGRRTAEMHNAFAAAADPAFGAEPAGPEDLASVVKDVRQQAERAITGLTRMRGTGTLGDDTPAARLVAARDGVLGAAERLSARAGAVVKTRVHGDFHLGQVLIVQNDVMIVDFEGEPSRPAEERRMKSPPLRDVAGMLRSFAYAAAVAGRDVAQRLPEQQGRILAMAAAWRAWAEAAYLAAYQQAVADGPAALGDSGAAAAVLDLYLLAKALYEVNYELDHRPDWVDIPVAGVLEILSRLNEAP